MIALSRSQPRRQGEGWEFVQSVDGAAIISSQMQVKDRLTMDSNGLYFHRVMTVRAAIDSS
ncbi:hypothetical protein EMIT0194P_130091 [Pseudomonas serbica]